MSHECTPAHRIVHIRNELKDFASEYPGHAEAIKEILALLNLIYIVVAPSEMINCGNGYMIPSIKIAKNPQGRYKGDIPGVEESCCE